MGLTGGQYLIKIIFDIKIEIDIFEISVRPNFNNFNKFYISTNYFKIIRLGYIISYDNDNSKILFYFFIQDK